MANERITGKVVLGAGATWIEAEVIDEDGRECVLDEAGRKVSAEEFVRRLSERGAGGQFRIVSRTEAEAQIRANRARELCLDWSEIGSRDFGRRAKGLNPVPNTGAEGLLIVEGGEPVANGFSAYYVMDMCSGRCFSAVRPERFDSEAIEREIHERMGQDWVVQAADYHCGLEGSQDVDPCEEAAGGSYLLKFPRYDDARETIKVAVHCPRSASGEDVEDAARRLLREVGIADQYPEPVGCPVTIRVSPRLRERRKGFGL